MCREKEDKNPRSHPYSDKLISTFLTTAGVPLKMSTRLRTPLEFIKHRTEDAGCCID